MKVVYRSNKSRTDRGWEEMRRLLDQEMPQKPDRKRPFLLWFFLLIGTGLATCLYFIQPGRQKTPLAALGANTVLPVIQPVMHETATQPNTSAKQRRFQQNTPSNTPFAATPIPVPPAIIDIQTQTLHSDISVPLAEVSVSGISGIQPALQHKRSALRLPIQPTSPNEQIIRKKTEKRPLSRQFKLGLTVGAIIGQVKSTPSLTAGFHLDYRPAFARQWGIRTGLAYRSQLFSGESRPIIPVSYDQYYRATFNQDIFPDTVSANWYVKARQNNVLVPVNKVHRIDVPLLVYWESPFHLKAMAGANFSRAVAVNSAQNSYFTYDLNVLKTPSDEAHNNLNNAMLNMLPPWEVQWQGGLAYSFNKHFEIGVHYRSTWMQKDPIVEEALDAYSNCLNCLSTFPVARQRTLKALRPQALLISAQFSF